MTTTTTSRAFRRWADVIESGSITRSQANAWAQTVGWLAMGGTPRRRTNLTPDEATQLMRMLAGRHPIPLAPTDAARGIDWLHRHGHHLADPRSGEPGRNPGYGLDPWTPVAFSGECADGSGAGWISPVWTVYGPDGTFRYYWRSTWREDAMAGFSRPGGGFGEWWPVVR